MPGRRDGECTRRSPINARRAPSDSAVAADVALAYVRATQVNAWSLARRYPMCIFSQDVRHVSTTKIFARLTGDRQHLVYEMRLASDSDVAMILPLPTRLASEDQARFLNLSDYDGFFHDLERCFPAPLSSSPGDLAVAGASDSPLIVHRVGAFDASFVPALPDFLRLDARFRLPERVWQQLPQYADFGFAVFQLRSGDARIHPMALSFRTRNTTALFFPTAHVHDGSVHPVAQFDHSLYAQAERPHSEWEHGSRLPHEVMNFGNFLVSDQTKGLVDPRTPIARCERRGPYPNQDTWLPVTIAG